VRSLGVDRSIDPVRCRPYASSIVIDGAEPYVPGGVDASDGEDGGWSDFFVGVIGVDGSTVSPPLSSVIPSRVDEVRACGRRSRCRLPRIFISLIFTSGGGIGGSGG
jgi:hypothetical protein